MDEIAPDIADFLADMPALDDADSGPRVVNSMNLDIMLPSPAIAVHPAMEGRAPDELQILEDMLAGFTPLPQSPDAAAGCLEAGEAKGTMGWNDANWISPADALRVPDRFQDGRLSLERDAGAGNTTLARLGIRVGGLHLTVPFTGASELSELLPVYRLPNVPSWFHGVANLHGNLLPVLDMAMLANSETEAGRERMLLVLGHGAVSAGIVINQLPSRFQLDAANAVAVPDLPDVLKSCVSGAYLHEREIWLDLDCGIFLETVAMKLAA